MCLRVLQITDYHIYSDTGSRLVGINTQTTMHQVFELAKAHPIPPDMVLATGDLVHDASVEGYLRLREELESFGVPVYCIPGNHDKPEILNRHMNGNLVSTAGQIDTGEWVLTLLDSTLADGEGGHLTAESLSRLEQTLQSNPDKHALICLHHHPVPVGSAWMDTIGIDNADEFFQVLDRYSHIRGIVCGHIHQSFDSTRNGVRILGTPSTCIQFTPRLDDFAIDDQAPGYRWLNLMSDGRIETGVERLESLPDGLDLNSGGY